MLTIAALLLAAATAATSAPVLSTSPWWEKITVTVAGDGKPQSCKYETNLRETKSNSCEIVGKTSGSAGGPAEAQYTRITFERRFTPGGTPPGEAQLELGDKLLGQQVMALAIDAAGLVKGCEVVATSGEMTPNYGCDEARTERFEASAAVTAPRQGFLTVLVYGHEEQIA